MTVALKNAVGMLFYSNSGERAALSKAEPFSSQ